ncbi:carboxypeptidase-like regulatory domain-containing protein [Roseivirga misakiensis]|uniref:TonB-dependent receptor plug domain-containing protein n=1 Tax=Roseivirga misakiensis TaxID=1563681 RepID=A0A1E5T131_9BACT|nr:carboxypeptidase-like regulatory domain-containing protein [Roseivirga misakiensis]OEK05069.1 hypothetical protein BFP71_16760 [Roseivirga misakiensis]
MISKHTIILILFLSTKVVLAQSTFTLRGVVTDAETKEPLPFATVFFAGTTVGTTTNEKGGYLLRVDAAGTYDLVVKFIGYKTYAAQVKLGAREVSRLNIEVFPGAKDLGSVVVVARKDVKWKEYIRQFERVFLGRSPNGLKAKIINKEAIDFVFDDENQRLTATAYKPVLIENLQLGYQVSYYLEDFFVEYSTGLTGYYGFASFDPLQPRNKRQEKKWLKNREFAYRGSSAHFFSALYRNRLTEEGFEIEITSDLSPIPEIMAYQKTILSEMITANKEDKFKQISFGDYLRVSYLKEKESSLYRSSTTLGGVKVSAPATPSNYQESWFQILEGYSSIEFESNGFVRNPISLQYYGYWAFEKVGDLMPLDYVPKSN